MAEYLIQDTTLISIADAIREKTGDEGTMKPAEFPEKIRTIETGGNIIPLIVTENGTYELTEGVNGYAPVTVNVPTGGGTGGGGTEEPVDGKYEVTVYDYDGTVLLNEWHNTGDIVELPSNPYHARLMFDGWTATCDIVDNTVTVGYNDIAVGALYYTVSGAMELDVTLTKVFGLTFNFADVFTGRTSIDWGDGTTDDTLTHTYSDYGDYTIKIYGATALTNTMFSGVTNAGAHNNIVQAIYLSKDMVNLNFYLKYNYNVKTISTHSGVQKMGVQNCGMLKHINIPDGVPYCNNCYSLETAVVSNGGSGYWSDNSFKLCPNLKKIVIPDNTYELSGFENFSSTYGSKLKRLIVPSGVKAFGMLAVYGLRTLEVLDFSNHTQVPNHQASDMSSSIKIQMPLLKIIVPASLYSTWIAASGWSNYANLIYPAE